MGSKKDEEKRHFDEGILVFKIRRQDEEKRHFDISKLNIFFTIYQIVIKIPYASNKTLE